MSSHFMVLLALVQRQPDLPNEGEYKFGAAQPRGEGVVRLLLVMTAMLVTMCFVLSGCASVHKEDLDAWEGAPVAVLDAHPIFLTMPVVRTKTSDGTEIRNYVNSANVSTCTGGGGVRVGPQQRGRFSDLVDTATYSSFSNCMQRAGPGNLHRTISGISA